MCASEMRTHEGGLKNKLRLMNEGDGNSQTIMVRTIENDDAFLVTVHSRPKHFRDSDLILKIRLLILLKNLKPF